MTLADEDDVLTLLGDRRNRELLRATADGAKTVGELSARCDVPRSTVYRKVEQLVEAGLLGERVRVRQDGAHPAEYVCPVDEIRIDLADGAGATDARAPSRRNDD